MLIGITGAQLRVACFLLKSLTFDLDGPLILQLRHRLSITHSA